MAASQSQLGSTLETFYGSSEQGTEGAIAAHAYKRAVTEIDAKMSSEVVCYKSTF
jgi:bridging integrator 3